MAGVVACVVSRVRIASPFLCRPRFSSVLCVAVFVVGGEVLWCAAGGTVSSSALLCSVLLSCLCVCCHSVVGLGVCLCGRVVSLWNGGDGLCVGWNGGDAMGVRFSFFVFSVLFLLFLFFFVLVFGVVRAQPCEHARYPRTPLCSSCCFVLSTPLFCSRPSPFFIFAPFYVLEWRGLPCVTVFGGHDSNRESVSFVFVFLVVACSSFTMSSVASSAVAFGA